MKYHIAMWSTITDLKNIVNRYLQNWWKLQGGLFITIRGDYYQALFKEEK